jgi:hypothetical protein
VDQVHPIIEKLFCTLHPLLIQIVMIPPMTPSILFRSIAIFMVDNEDEDDNRHAFAQSALLLTFPILLESF